MPWPDVRYRDMLLPASAKAGLRFHPLSAHRCVCFLGAGIAYSATGQVILSG